MRPDNNVGSRQAHPPSDASRSRLSVNPSPTPRFSTQTRDSALSNIAGSLFSRASAPTGLTAHSRTDSTPHEQNYRDSFVSIVDDPFFQRYDPALDAGTAANASNESLTAPALQLPDFDFDRTSVDEELDQVTYNHDSDDNASDQRWPPPRRESLIIGYSSYWVCRTLF